MIEKLFIFYFLNSAAFIAADFYVYRGVDRLLGPPYVLHPNPVNLFWLFLTYPISIVFTFIAHKGRVRSCNKPSVHMIFYYIIVIFLFDESWGGWLFLAYLGFSLWMFLVRSASRKLR